MPPIPKTKKPKRFAARYPWDEWFEKGKRGKIILVQGQHYHCTNHGMMQNARLAAQREGIRLRIEVHSDHITLEVV